MPTIGSAPRRRFAALILLASLAVVAALAARGPQLAAQSAALGDENSWLRIQNVGAQPATVEVSFFDLAGRRVATDSCPRVDTCGALAPGLGWSFFQQGFTGLPDGYRGSAFVKVDQPFVALMARDVFKGGQFQIAGDTLRLGSGVSSYFLPVVQNSGQYVSRISVENTSETRDSCVEIRYWAQHSSAPTSVDPPGATPGCPAGGTRLVPRATLLRDERNLPVPGDFDGSAVVRALDTGAGVRAGDQTLAVAVDTRERAGAGLSTVRGIGSDELSRTVVLPLIDRNGSQGQSTWTTRFRILNGTPGVPNEVLLRFEGTNAAGEQLEIEHKVTVVSSLTCDQRSNGAAGCLPPDRPLPPTFIGTVRMQSVQPIAVVAQRLGDGAFGDYRGFTTDEAARQVVLPVLNKNFGPFGEERGWNSWFRLLTFDGTVAHARVVYFSRQFANGLVSDPFPVDRMMTVRQWEDRRLPDGWVGSAVVIADRPIVAVVNLESEVFRGDPVMLYNGISFD